jgi:hypothetical protein
MVLCQRRYIDDILDRFSMKNSNPVASPVDISVKFNDLGDELSCSSRYLICATRPDIAFAVGIVARYVETPKLGRWAVVKGIFRYLQGKKSYGIRFDLRHGIDFNCYSDADWAADVVDRKSTSGFVFQMVGGPDSWGSKKETSVSLLTSGTAYMTFISSKQSKFSPMSIPSGT